MYLSIKSENKSELYIEFIFHYMFLIIEVSVFNHSADKNKNALLWLQQSVK